MKVEVLLIGKRTGSHPPSRYTLYRKTLRESESSVYATHSYVWTRDSFWGNLVEVPISCDSDAFYAYRGEIDVAFNDGDADVILMLGKAITLAVEDLVCRVSIIADVPLLHSPDVLLLHLADALEEKHFHLHFLEWANETEWSYHKGLEGRLWFNKGQVHLMSPTAKTISFDSKSNSLTGDFQPVFSVLSRRADISVYEKMLSDAVDQWIRRELETTMRQSAVSLFVRLPPVLAGVITDLPPALLKECLLDHLLNFPVVIDCEFNDTHVKDCLYVEKCFVRPQCEPHTHWCSRSARRAHLSLEDEQKITERETATLQYVYNELLTTYSSNKIVRVPILSLPTYIFILLKNDSFPSNMLDDLCNKSTSVQNDPSKRKQLEEEIALGAKICFAMERWRCANSGETPITGRREKSSVEVCNRLAGSFQKIHKLLNEKYCQSLSSSSSLSMDRFDHFRKKVMYPFPLEYPISIISNAPVEELLFGKVTDKGRESNKKNVFERFDSVMQHLGNHQHGESRSSSSSSTVSSSEYESVETCSRSSSRHSTVVNEVLDEMNQVFFDELHLTEEVHHSNEFQGRGVNVDEGTVGGIVDNKMFLNALQSLADN